MHQITPSDVQHVIDVMRSRTSRWNKPYQPATIKQVLVLMKRLYNWSIKMELCPEIVNPGNRIEIPRFDNQVTNPFTREDLKILNSVLDQWENERPVLVIRFALYSGKRLGEILSLTWKDVDLQSGNVTFQGLKTKNGRTQTLPLNRSCLELLSRCKELQSSEWVFPCSTGKYFHNFGCIWQRIRKKAGLSQYRFHDLRHTYASYLASSGKVDIYTLKELLGHRTLDMTARYAHLVNGALKKATCVADNIFK